ncbi:MarR family winged helix-turn-helix transcriptional regulator [uncultured Agrobacterium sp.]|uniref:MarR family winged helix-turn-helix transcriptional regulator n=1 Tax=uncultured Agrobacterium sp. TaxID=157277 RepID=UPI0025E45314|nr:MarR family winged helix-turn-helix transcriptional regulator [uncultured Agrobacterium sp.]
MTSTNKVLDRAANKALDKTLDLVRMFRALSSEMPMQQAHILLYIASRPGITMFDLSEETQLAQSSCSRSVAALSKFKSLGQPGLNLVEAAIDPHEPRRRILFLTQQGEKFISEAMSKIDPSFVYDRDANAQTVIQKAHEEAMANKGVAKAFNPARTR